MIPAAASAVLLLQSSVAIAAEHTAGDSLLHLLDKKDGPGRHDCGVPEPTAEDKARANANMIKTFGKTGDNMTKLDLSTIVKGVVELSKNYGMPGTINGIVGGYTFIGNIEQGIDKELWNRNFALNPAYSLVNMPIVYRVMTGQHIPKSNPTLDAIRPSATSKQLAFMTEQTNKLHNIYDKASKTSVQ